MTDSVELHPRMTLRVGVTGHRPDNEAMKAAIAEGGLEDKISKLLRCLSAAVQDLHAQDQNPQDIGNTTKTAAYSSEDPEFRLATALAAGADCIAAKAAVREGYLLSCLLPYMQAPAPNRPNYRPDFTDEEWAGFQELWQIKNGPRLELDVSDENDDPLAYQAAGRLVLAHCDVLLAIWDGEPSGGVGGTRDTMEEALRRGHRVIWLDLKTGNIILWPTQQQGGDPRVDPEYPRIDLEKGSCDPVLQDMLETLLAFPETQSTDQSDHHNGSKGAHGQTQSDTRESLKDYYDAKEKDDAYLIFGYDWLRFIFNAGGSLSLKTSFVTGPDGDQKRWKKISDAADKIEADANRDRESLSNRIDRCIVRRWRRADRLANEFSARYRSAYVWNFISAALAVFFGLLIILYPTDYPPLEGAATAFSDWKTLEIKAILVLIELVLVLGILLRTWWGVKKHWHERWLDYRYIAESLRPAPLSMLMGSSPLRPELFPGGAPGQDWVMWYVRACLREIEPPSGVIGREELRLVINAALETEVEPQIKYHALNKKRMHKLFHGIEKLAKWLLIATLGVGGLYLIVFAIYWVTDHKWLSDQLKSVGKPWFTFLGGILPVFGAALFGIRVTGDFGALERQSKRTLASLESIQANLLKECNAEHSPNRIRLRRSFAHLSTVLSADVHLWGTIYSERPLPAGF
ncbi:MAG: hypothetical protein AAGF94_02665 [Pseudomonadota bacterium]